MYIYIHIIFFPYNRKCNLFFQAFELPRATKFPHKDAPPLPEFHESPPKLAFAAGTEDVFKARVSSQDACIQSLDHHMVSTLMIWMIDNYFPNSLAADARYRTVEIVYPVSVEWTIQIYKKWKRTCTFPPLRMIHRMFFFLMQTTQSYNDSSLKNATFTKDCQDQDEAMAPPADRTTTDFNKTLDMTLRSSGPLAFGVGLLLVIDEMLDPIVGFLLPYGLRRRGANLAVATATFIIGGIAWLFCASRR